MNLTDNVFHVEESAKTGWPARAWKLRLQREEWVALIYIRHSGVKIFRNFNYISSTSHYFHVTTGMIKGGIISRKERGLHDA